MATSHLQKAGEILDRLPEWQKLVKHFELADDRFAYIPLLTKDGFWLDVCQNHLTEFLREKNKSLQTMNFTSVDKFSKMASEVLQAEVDKDTGALWISIPVVTDEIKLEEWKAAWRENIARLNQYRNTITDRFKFPLIFAGDFWTQEESRTMAPDLWSIRTTVVRIEPPVSPFTASGEGNISIQGDSVASLNLNRSIDVDFVMEQAYRLRGKDRDQRELVDLLFRAAQGYSARGEFLRALDAIDEAIFTVRTYEVKDEITLAQFLSLRGQILFSLGEFPEVEKTYSEALEIYRSNVSDETLKFRRQIAFVLTQLGEVHIRLGLFDVAEKELNEALEIRRVLAMENPDTYVPDTAVTLSGLSYLHTITRDFEKAERESEEALSLLRRSERASPGEYQRDIAGVLYNLAGLHMDMHYLESAEQEYKESLAIRLRLAETEPTIYVPEIAVTLNNLGTLYGDRGEFDKAREVYEEALRIYRGLAEWQPKLHKQNVAMTLNNLANLESDIGDLYEAEKKYKESLDIRREVVAMNPNSSRDLEHIAIALVNLGNLHYRKNELDQTEKTHKDALDIYRNLSSKEPVLYERRYAMALAFLARTHTALGNVEAAEEEYIKSIEIYTRLEKEQTTAFDPYFAVTLANAALFFQSVKPDRERSESFAIRAIDMMQLFVDRAPYIKSSLETATNVISNWESLEGTNAD